MKQLLILGAGTGGTMVANKMSRMLDNDEWQITIVDRDTLHYYQPGFLFVPFGIYKPQDVIKPKRNFIAPAVKFVDADVEVIEAQQNQVRLTNGDILPYDYLVIATGTDIHPEETEGLLDGGAWHKNIYDFYTYDGTSKLATYLDQWEGGRLVVNVAEMPIKCPVAPLEFLFLADWYFRERGIRNKVELTYATPLAGAFTKPICTEVLSGTLYDKGIHVETEFNIGEVDTGKQVIRSWDEREIDYDLLVTVPTNMGADMIGRSGLGDDLNFVPVNKHTLQSTAYENIFAIGDATNAPTSKAGSVAHFMLEPMTDNLLRHMQGKSLVGDFDGHANCFIESGAGKAILIDFNYDTEPLPGQYPLPGVGPFKLLEETRINHQGKMAFRWMYWNILLKALPVPVISNQMSMSGKVKPELAFT